MPVRTFQGVSTTPDKNPGKIHAPGGQTGTLADITWNC